MTVAFSGFARVSAAVPMVHLGHAQANCEQIIALWQQAEQRGSDLVVFPELALTGYAIADLLLDAHLHAQTVDALTTLCQKSQSLRCVAVVGLPLRIGHDLYNTAAILQSGRILGVVPKSYLPNSREFAEMRWFRSGLHHQVTQPILLCDQTVPFGTQLLFCAANRTDFSFGVEICEDMWAPVSPAHAAIAAGATVICNLSASTAAVGKSDKRRLLAAAFAERTHCAYIYAGAGAGESTTDVVFDGDAFIYEESTLQRQSSRFSQTPQLITADIDITKLVYQRISDTTFGQFYQSDARPDPARFIEFNATNGISQLAYRTVKRQPFVPDNDVQLQTRCQEIFAIQGQGLITRLNQTHCRSVILGLSGGIDSSYAALVAHATLKKLSRPLTDLHCVIMPGLGSTDKTQQNAVALAQSLGATIRQLSIAELTHTVLQHLGHGATVATADAAALRQLLQQHPEHADVTLENCQARLRTLLLFSLANQHNGLVLGTGDLSEKALGWSTYGGDHLSSYDINAGLPKTLIQHLMRWASDTLGADAEIVAQVLQTPISPELLPPQLDGTIQQQTEAIIGPYELHDFFLYCLLRYRARPARILDLARTAFESQYDLPILKGWLTLFYRRFFSQQFKRSCTADGPKVGLVALSPRGDWRMPSDAEVSSWLSEIDHY